jgi:lysophospholipase L1-like esterase
MRRLVVLFLAVVALATSCSSGATDTTPAAATGTTTVATTTTTMPLTTTATPTTTVVTTTAAPAKTVTTTVPESDVQPLVLVAFGDSVISYPEPSEAAIGAYAAVLEEEFGRPVLIRNRAVWASTPTQLLIALASEPVQADLAKADVVLLEIPLGDTNPAFPTAVGSHGSDPADCGGDDHQQCLRDYVTENKASVEAIYSALTAICDPSDTLIRALDTYVLHVEDQHESGTLHITNPYIQETRDFLHETAAGYGIPVARVYDEFMGPDGTDDPQDRGLVMTDQRHPTEAGALLIAEMLHDLGYDLAS